MRLDVLGVPVLIRPMILVTAFLIGPHQDPAAMLLWIPLVLAGVLVHELGHALVVRRLGHAPVIELHALGGTTSWRHGGDLSAGQRIAVSAAGPAVGIAIGLACLAAWTAAGPVAGGLADRALQYAVWVNLGWGVLNLAPVLPLDGGNIVTTAAEAVAGRRGLIVMLAVSIVLTAALAVWGLTTARWWLALVGAVLTVSNVQVLRGTWG